MSTETMPAPTTEKPMDLAQIKRDLLADQLAAAKAAAKRLRDQMIAMLPWATAEQFEVVKLAAQMEAKAEDSFKVNEDFRLTDSQKSELEKVKEARVKHLTENKDHYVKPLFEDPEQKLVSVKVRTAKAVTRTTLRLEKKLAEVK